jgi:hypothetical protein
VKPKVKPVKDSYWKENSASQQKSPRHVAKAKKDMGKPCKNTRHS